MTWPQAISAVPPDDRYEVEERAAIHEFDGGMERSAAEQRALAEYWMVLDLDGK